MPLLAVWDCAALFRQSPPAPQLSSTAAGTETHNRDVFDHGSKKDLHHFHDFFPIEEQQQQRET